MHRLTLYCISRFLLLDGPSEASSVLDEAALILLSFDCADLRFPSEIWIVQREGQHLSLTPKIRSLDSRQLQRRSPACW